MGDVRVMCSVQKIRGKVPTFHGEGEVEIVKHWCEEKTYVPGQLVISVRFITLLDWYGIVMV